MVVGYWSGVVDERWCKRKIVKHKMTAATTFRRKGEYAKIMVTPSAYGFAIHELLPGSKVVPKI